MTRTAEPATWTPAPTTYPWVRRVVLANVVFQVLILVTGGIVRLTGSGLGCSTWPACDPGHYTPTFKAADGIHPYIEFGNRMLGVVVGIVAILTVVAVWRWARHRTPMLALAIGVAAGTGAQGLLGGITVRTGLNPATVMLHFLISATLIVLSTALVWRERQPDAPSRLVVPPLVAGVAWLTAAVGAVVVVLGTVVTGSGPHSGDADDPARFGFDPRSVAWVHADAVMVFVGLVIAVLLAVHLVPTTPRTQQVWRVVLLVTLAQAAVGYTQYLTGLPEVLVLVHMFGAAALTVAVTCGVLVLRDRGGSAEEPGGSAEERQRQVQQRVERDTQEDQRQIADREVEQPHRA